MRFASVPGPDGPYDRPVGLDNTAVMMTGQALGVDLALVAAILPRIEAAVINPPEGNEQEADDGNS